MRISAVAKVVIVNDEGKVLFLRRSQSDTNRPGQWDLPGGNVDEGEDFKQAVMREAKEEAGIVLSDPIPVYGYSEPRPPHGFPTWVFFAEKIRQTPHVALSFEHDGFEWFALDEALQHIQYPLHRQLLTYIADNALLSLLP